MAKVGSGNVIIMLDGHEYQLVPTLAAAQGVSRLSGGIRGAIDSVLKFDLDVVTNVVRLGLGPKVVKDIGHEFAEVIWRSGMTDSSSELAAKCIEYLTILSNGGRPLPSAGEARDDSANPQSS